MRYKNVEKMSEDEIKVELGKFERWPWLSERQMTRLHELRLELEKRKSHRD